MIWIQSRISEIMSYKESVSHFFKTSLKAFSHQRRAKSFNTLRSKADSFERRIIVIKFSCQKMNCLKKPYLAKKAISAFLAKKPFLAQKAISGLKAISNLAKYFWPKKQFWPKSINLTNTFYIGRF